MPKPAAIKEVSAQRAHWTIIVYADPGVGKTWLAATSAKEDHDTLIVRPPTDHTDTIDIHFDVIVDEWVVHDWQDMDEVHEYLRHEDHGYRWVWMDSVSLVQEIGLDGIMQDLVTAKPHRNEHVPDRGEYGENMNRLSKWIRNMSALDFNFGMTAHVIRYTSPKTGDEHLMPWVQGKMMPEKICGYANVVGHLDIIESEKHGEVRVLHVKPHDEYYAKDGFGAFSGRILRPDISKMEEEVKKAKKSKRKKSASKKRSIKSKSKTAEADEDEDFTF